MVGGEGEAAVTVAEPLKTGNVDKVCGGE